MMGEDFDTTYHTLRRTYLEEMPARLADLRKDVAAFEAGERDAASSLTSRFHQIAGSGGSYGFPEVSQIARAAETWLAEGGAGDPGADGRLQAWVVELTAALDRAAGEVPADASAERVVPPDFGWRAVVVGGGDVSAAVHESLTTAGFLVERGGEHQEVNATPMSERPDLVVLVGNAADFSLHTAAAAWRGARSVRPRGVALVDTGDSDRLMAIAAGVDVIYTPDQVTTDLPRFAKTLARIGAPPVAVLLVEDDPLQAQLVAGALEAANIRVYHAEDTARAQEYLAILTPDVFLLDVELPDVDGFTLARLIRQDPRFNLVPIVFLTARTSMASHIEALRAGADDFLTKPIDQSLNLLLQVVIARAERGRRIREMVHKDGLTGLLNHATLMAELHNAVEYAQRNSEHFSFLMVDIDHFKRVNDRYGHLVGDQVLLHVARLFQATARASDLIGRYGGEEFGMILRRSNRAGAGIVAQKLRTALREHPAETEDGEPIPVHVSIGVATYPEDGTRASEVAHAADLALYRAKTAGRDCVVFAATVS